MRTVTIPVKVDEAEPTIQVFKVITDDIELQSISVVVEIMKRLNTDQRARVLGYLNKRFEYENKD